MGRTWVRVRFVLRIYAAVRTSIPLRCISVSASPNPPRSKPSLANEFATPVYSRVGTAHLLTKYKF